MSRMTVEELSDLAKQGKVEEIIGQLFSGDPFAFKDRPIEYPKFRSQIAAAIKCEAARTWLSSGVDASASALPLTSSGVRSTPDQTSTSSLLIRLLRCGVA